MNNPSIPDDFPLVELVAQELAQICIGPHSISLNFNKLATDARKSRPGASLRVEAGYALTSGGAALCASLNEGLGHRAGGLTVLLQRHITAVARLTNNELLLSFSGGYNLQLMTDTTGFESYRIQIDGNLVAVACAP